MYCKECGKEIREGNIFCTNCGTSINNEKSNKSPIKIKFNHLIIGIVLIVIVIIGIFVYINTKDKTISDNSKAEMLVSNYDESINTEEIIKNWDVSDDTLNENQEQEVIEEANNDVQESNVSTTDNNEVEENNSKIETEEVEENNSRIETEEFENYIEENESQEDYHTTVQFSRDELENKTEDELIKLFEENGLIPEVTKAIKEVPYLDELANTTAVTYIQSDFGYYYYNKGDTVKITTTYYKPIPWTATIYFSASSASFKVDDKDCLVRGTNAGTYCFFKDPRELDSYFVYDTTDGKGVEFYINNELLYSGSYGSSEYTFDEINSSITLKLVAPYVYEYSREILNGVKGNMIGTNVTVYEEQLNVKELYKNKRGNTVELEIE